MNEHSLFSKFITKMQLENKIYNAFVNNNETFAAASIKHTKKKEHFAASHRIRYQISSNFKIEIFETDNTLVPNWYEVIFLVFHGAKLS